LIFKARISLSSALNSDPIELITLDGRKIHIPIDEVISPKTVKQVKEEGMPIYNKDEFKVEHFGKSPHKGDLFIKFEIVFPKNISEENKLKLREILND